jgi:lysozyme
VRFHRDPLKQAENFAGALAELGGGDLPPAVDLERHKSDWPPARPAPLATQVRKVAHTLLGELEARTGRRALIYGGAYFLDENGLEDLAGRELWLAGYLPERRLRIPHGWRSWRIWQYSGSGQAPGITGAVDLNVFRGGEEELRAWAAASRACSQSRTPEDSKPELPPPPAVVGGRRARRPS